MCVRRIQVTLNDQGKYSANNILAMQLEGLTRPTYLVSQPIDDRIQVTHWAEQFHLGTTQVLVCSASLLRQKHQSFRALPSRIPKAFDFHRR
jgi:hypothetical protein